jgi:hypothetical protein
LLFTDIKQAVRKLEGLMRYHYARKSEPYIFLFEKGLSEFNKLNQSNIIELLTRVQVFFKKNQNMLFSDVISNIDKLYQEYSQCKNFKQSYTFEFRECVSDKGKLRIELSKRLQKNIYIIAMDNLGDQKVSKEFFNEKLLAIKKFTKRQIKAQKEMSDMLSAENVG